MHIRKMLTEIAGQLRNLDK